MSKKSQFVVKLLKYKTLKNTQLERLQIPESRSRMLALTFGNSSKLVWFLLKGQKKRCLYRQLHISVDKYDIRGSSRLHLRTFAF